MDSITYFEGVCYL